METKASLTKEANPRAISVRIETRSFQQVTGQRHHDLRIGRQPAYVDPSRAGENDVLIKPATAPELRQICIDRRSLRATRRAMKRNAAVATTGIITFGIEAQVAFAALDRRVQNEAITAIAEALAARLMTTVSGLVAHRDETAIHAHFQMPAVNVEGNPLTQANSLSDISKLQDLAAEVVARFAPSIERGHKKRDRLAAGATSSEVVHRSVRELHRDLPLELENKRLRVAEMEARVSALAAKCSSLTAAENKRLETYKKRLQDRLEQLRLVEAAAEAAAEAVMAVEKQKILDKANEDAAAIRKAAQENAESLLANVGLFLSGQVLPVVENGVLAWTAAPALDRGVFDRFMKGVGWFLPVYKRFQPILNALSKRLIRARELVNDLEQFRDQMNQQQCDRLDKAQTELDDASP